jgi:hypothetical protein
VSGLDFGVVSRRLLVRSAAGANVEQVSSPAPAVSIDHDRPSTSNCQLLPALCSVPSALCALPQSTLSTVTLIAIEPISVFSTCVSDRKDLDVSLLHTKHADVRESRHSAVLKVEMEFCESRWIRFNIL